MHGANEVTNVREWLSMRARALRAFSFPVSVLPVLVATAAVSPVGQWRWDVLICSLLGAVFLHAAGNLLNDYFDFRSGVDRKVDGDEGRPGRLLVRGELVPKDVLVEAVVCLLLALSVAVYLVWRCGPGLLWFGAAALFAVYAYTGAPLHLKYRALGEPLVFVIFGPLLMTGAAYAQTGRVEPAALLFSVPVGFATTAILVGNNIRDYQEDRDAGTTTLAHAIGIRAVTVLYVLLVVLCVCGVAVLGMVLRGPYLLMAAPVLLVIMRGPLSAVAHGERLPDIDAQTARFESLVLLFLLVVLTLHGGAGPS